MLRRCLMPALLLAARAAGAFEPVSAYTTDTVSGFTVLVHREVLAHTNELADARLELGRQLDVMTAALPGPSVAALRGVRIWLEWEAKKNGGAEFHPSRDWLVAHDYHPEKARNVEISNTRNFISWSRRTQPCMVLHEFAHAYHFIVLGHDYAPVREAFERVKKAGLYESVEFVRGGKQRHYALTNDKEFFAEFSEAYFGRNDFHPFTRDDLRHCDPETLAVIGTAWRSPPAKKQAVAARDNRRPPARPPDGSAPLSPRR